MAVTPSPAREAVRGTVPKMIEVAEEVIYGDIWERPGLSKRDRSLIVVASLISQYRLEQLRGHLVRALDHGVTKDEIAEIITHLVLHSTRLARIDDSRKHRTRRVRGAWPRVGPNPSPYTSPLFSAQ